MPQAAPFADKGQVKSLRDSLKEGQADILEKDRWNSVMRACALYLRWEGVEMGRGGATWHQPCRS